MCRESLKDGKHRAICSLYIPLLSFLASLFFLLYFCSILNFFTQNQSHVINILKFSCGLSASFALMSYNLRNKALDFYQKLITSDIISESTAKDELTRAKETSASITNITLQSLFTTILIGISIEVPFHQHFLWIPLFSLSVGFFLSSLSEYIHVLFAIEKAEFMSLDFLMDQKSIEEKQKDRNRLNKAADQSDTPIPPNW